MKGRPWYKRYPADFLHGCMQLSLLEKGAYSVALDLMYERGGPIADDPKWIARMCGCSIQQWKKLRESLIEAGKLNITADGRLSNGRVVYELHRSDGEADAFREAGRRGGRARAEKHRESTDTPRETPDSRGVREPNDPRSEIRQDFRGQSCDSNDVADGRLPQGKAETERPESASAAKTPRQTPDLVEKNMPVFSDDREGKQPLSKNSAQADSETQTLEGSPVPTSETHHQQGSPTSAGESRTRKRARAPTRERGMRLPDEWAPNATCYLTGADLGFSREEVCRIADLFRDHAQANGRRQVDWQAAFRMWLRNELAFRSRFGRPQDSNSTSDRRSASGREAAAAKRNERAMRGLQALVEQHMPAPTTETVQ